jgi:hypothetical protein
VGASKPVTISQEADGWWVRFSCADVAVRPLPPSGKEAGMDLEIEKLAALSAVAHFSP